MSVLLFEGQTYRMTVRKETSAKTQPKSSRRFQVHVLPNRCKGCHFCIEMCPKKVLSESTELNQKGYRTVSAEPDSDCSGCGLCELVCPDFAIYVVPEGNKANG
jgi:2-oxoglutarate ferredoxin oxidoreductase subunit delta